MSAIKGNGKSAFDVGALLEKAKKLGCSQAEVYEARSSSTPVSFENNKLKSVETAETAVVAMRVIKDGKLGMASSTRPGDTTVAEMAARAAEFGPAADFDFASAAPAAGDLETSDPAVRNWKPEEMASAGAGLVETLKGLEDGVLAGVDLGSQWGYQRLATSVGQDLSAEGTAAAIFAAAELVEPENMIAVHHFAASRRLDVDAKAVGQRIVWLFQNARHNVPMRGGSYPVIFSPSAATDLLSPFEACIDGKAVVKGESPWKDRIGEKLLADGFTLYDDPTLPWGLATTPFDDEGVPTRKRVIIEKGELRDFNLDLRSAKALGKKSTGNGFRGGAAAPPAPHPTNFVLEPGRTPVDELVKGIKEGLYVNRLMGAWTGNPYTGQVTGNIVTGFRVANGEIVGRVKDCMLSVNVFEAFRDHLLALSKEAEVASAHYRLPYILLDNVSVSTKG